MGYVLNNLGNYTFGYALMIKTTDSECGMSGAKAIDPLVALFKKGRKWKSIKMFSK